MIKQFSDHIWTIEKPFKLLGANFGNRSTIVKLFTGKLLVHSPVKIDKEDAEEIQKLGEVQFVVAPNNFHHLHLRHFKKFFPDATYQATESLQNKRPNFQFDGTVDPKSLFEWSNDLEHVYIFGMPKVHEVAYFHRQDRVLIITDLFFNFTEYNLPLKLLAKTMGCYGRPSASRLFKFMIWNRREFRESLQELLDLDFESIILSHGSVIRNDGKSILKSVFDDILKTQLQSRTV